MNSDSSTTGPHVLYQYEQVIPEQIIPKQVVTVNCDERYNFIENATYKQHVLTNGIKQDKAVKECMALANGNDFFVQQHKSNLHTICGVYDKKEFPTDPDFVKHGHEYGSICKVV